MRTLVDILYDVQQRTEDLPAYLDQEIQDLVKEAYALGREEGVDIGRTITEKYGRPLFE